MRASESPLFKSRPYLSEVGQQLWGYSSTILNNEKLHDLLSGKGIAIVEASKSFGGGAL